MKNINQIGLTWISFLSYAFTGALVVVTGMIMKNIAQYFNLSIAEMSNTFTYLNAGILISILLNSWISGIISLKKQLISGFFLTIIAILGIICCKSILFFSINMFILGLVSGITMSIGTFLITHLYSGSKRGSRLLLTDSFFSMSGMIFPIVAAYLIEKNIIWYWIYIYIGGIYLLIFILTMNLDFPKIKHNIETLSAMLYILGQLGFISWVPQYVSEHVKIHLEKTGILVSNFWMSYMIGMWFFSIIIKFFNLYHMFMFLSSISTLLMYYFIHGNNLLILKYVIVGLGFFSSAIYTIIITLTSLQTIKPSPKLINLILLFGTIGTLLTFIITSPIVEKEGLYAALITSNVMYSIVFLISVLIFFNKKT
jgi:TsgA-like MFS transporter